MPSIKAQRTALLVMDYQRGVRDRRRRRTARPDARAIDLAQAAGVTIRYVRVKLLDGERSAVTGSRRKRNAPTHQRRRRIDLAGAGRHTSRNSIAAYASRFAASVRWSSAQPSM